MSNTFNVEADDFDFLVHPEDEYGSYRIEIDDHQKTVRAFLTKDEMLQFFEWFKRQFKGNAVFPESEENKALRERIDLLEYHLRIKR